MSRLFFSNARGLVLAETGTVGWFAMRFDKVTFAIFDAFDDEAGLTAHLNGAAAALMANAADLLAVAPEIRQPAVLADKLPT